jgi:hypothetical protein
MVISSGSSTMNVTTVIFYALFCYIVQNLSKFLSSTLIPNFGKLTKQQQQTWFNRTVSTIHAAIMFHRAFHYWRFENPNFIIPYGVSSYEALTIDIMMGYLVYDTFYELRISPLDKMILAHHIVGGISHFLTRYLNNGSSGFYR